MDRCDNVIGADDDENRGMARREAAIVDAAARADDAARPVASPAARVRPFGRGVAGPQCPTACLLVRMLPNVTVAFWPAAMVTLRDAAVVGA